MSDPENCHGGLIRVPDGKGVVFAPRKPDTAGPVILWICHGCEGWSPTSFPDIKSALEAEKYTSDWVITKAVQYEVTEINQ